MKKTSLKQPPVRSNWGGKRPGAGRKPKDPRRGPGVSHLRKPDIDPRFPLAITLVVSDETQRPGSRKALEVLRGTLEAVKERSGFRVLHSAVDGRNLRLIVEADGREALTRGMQSLQIRAARALNADKGRKGRVFADRFGERVLRTKGEVDSERKALAAFVEIAAGRGKAR